MFCPGNRDIPRTHARSPDIKMRIVSCCCIPNTKFCPSSVPFQSLSSSLLSELRKVLLSSHLGLAHKCKIQRTKKDPLHFDCDMFVNLSTHRSRNHDSSHSSYYSKQCTTLLVLNVQIYNADCCNGITV